MGAYKLSQARPLPTIVFMLNCYIFNTGVFQQLSEHFKIVILCSIYIILFASTYPEHWVTEGTHR